ncbi:MAG: hypothetical protein AABX11_04470 [Nanoarchaeota archaeon]
MKILILDKDHPTAEGVISQWKAQLESRGHTVHYDNRLNNLKALARRLSDYNFIIGHPVQEDVSQLYSELHQRKDLRMILHSGINRYEPLEAYSHSDRITYISADLVTKNLVPYVEQGWTREESRPKPKGKSK